ncbi:MAG TPA: FliA/WhiG family RNA polymerase sigma factor [Candidatus Sulfotelmatobacter sp.]|nr:FliA/WhiG family RNA polymerase sigma factor [Candidatus Sulfotelmatobacter sp.]
MLTTSAKPDDTATAGDSAERERLLRENLPEVRYIARRIHDRLPPHVPFDDLLHAGILGLIDAIDKFDPSRNVQLKSYARFRIRGAILDSLRQMDWSPRALRRQARRIEDAQRALGATLGRAPNESEIAAHLGMALEDYQRLLGELRGLDLGSLYAGPEEDEVEKAHPSLTTQEEEDPFTQCLRSEMRTLLAEAIEELGEKERHVLGLYYLEELTMKEVGAILDLGESRVSQIHTAAILRLRSRLREKLEAQRQATAAVPAHKRPV